MSVLTVLFGNAVAIGGEPAQKQTEYCVIPSLLSKDVRPVVIPLDDRPNLRLLTVYDIWADVAYHGLNVTISSNLAREFSGKTPDKTTSDSWQWMNEN